ncbi:MAG TPA: bi-domain-containing oxidoreductase [Bacteroidales bacterium]|jgi:polar amino acid transport system substrate-binding protein|nr:bi-domain-containing oxidoreductase [Bacteroidales bacterium]
MKQLIQNFKSGEMYVDEIPAPAISAGMVLVGNEFSLISAGTERGTVKIAQANLLGKAKERPDLVAQVIKNIKKEGITATLNKVRTKLDSLKALGYSSAGVVKASLDKNGLFRPGDRVACAGQDYASHAAVISVPQNLVARIPDNVSSEEAAFTTVGSIALQGIRQASPNLGEKVAVIGLGLLGQITCQLLKANGCMVFGIDLNEKLVKTAQENAGVIAMRRDDANIVSSCLDFSDGYGFDSVIITAATQSNDPVELAASIARKKAKIVIVGAVGMELHRDPYFYRKELELIMSCSYGPGRYDPSYEEGGHDYPYPYVRWTEQRNMEAFLGMLSMKVINVKPLITHVFDISDAEKAYDIVLGKTKEFSSGILLRYAPSNGKERSLVNLKNDPSGSVSTGFIGAGSFAQSYLIPAVRSSGGSLNGVVTTRGITSKNVASKFGFNYCSTNIDDVLNDKNINTVFIATPHASHASLVAKALEARKNVFVEKPLAINMEQLAQVMEARNNFRKPVMVGFNRRFSAVAERIRSEFETIAEPLLVNIRVNAGIIPGEHWIQNPEIGGGRIIGEVCHFIDLMQFLTGSEPVSVFAESVTTDSSAIAAYDNIAVVVKFRNGSVGNLMYLANGDSGLAKERIEVSGGGSSAVINDFRDGILYRNGKTIKLDSKGKGHREEVQKFFDALVKGVDSPLSFRSACLTTVTTFRILDSLSTGLPQDISLP